MRPYLNAVGTVVYCVLPFPFKPVLIAIPTAQTLLAKAPASPIPQLKLSRLSRRARGHSII